MYGTTKVGPILAEVKTFGSIELMVRLNEGPCGFGGCNCLKLKDPL